MISQMYMEFKLISVVHAKVLVGQGARRVRDLFRVAKERAPCVVFIDEIDSVGSKRSYSQLHPYANQTINQLLSEMDGFVSSEGVIVLGATNRSEDLDKALLRPGRFDTQASGVRSHMGSHCQPHSNQEEFVFACRS